MKSALLDQNCSNEIIMRTSERKTAFLPENDENHKQHYLPGMTWVLKNQN